MKHKLHSPPIKKFAEAPEVMYWWGPDDITTSTVYPESTIPEGVHVVVP